MLFFHNDPAGVHPTSPTRCAMRKSSLLPLLVLVTVLSAVADAAPPQISSLSVRGLQVGGTTRIVVSGRNLLPNPRVVLPFPVRHQKLLPKSNSNRIEMEVQLDKASPAGFCQFRVACDQGMSNPMPIGLDRLEQLPFATSVKRLPVALNGVLQASTILRVDFPGKKGMDLVVEVESKRLAAKLNPVVRILDAQGRQLHFGGPQSRLGGDARAFVRLPANGTSTAVIHDRLYKGQGPGHFRLKIGAFKYADLVYPLVVSRGKKQRVQLLSTNLDPSQRSILIDPGASRGASHQAVQLPASASGANPALRIADVPVVVESPRSKQGTKIRSAPVLINGQILNPAEEDRFRVPVKPGQRLRVEVIAQQLGSRLDGVLTIRDPSGKQLAANDDRPNTSDPALNYNVPNGVTAIDVCVRDLHGANGADYVYLIDVEDLGRQDYQLSLTSDRLNVAAKGNQVIQVQATRRGYAGDIQLSIQGLPPGVQVQGGKIRSGQNIGLLTISARNSRPIHWLARVVGTAKIGNATVTRVAQLGADATTGRLPYLRADTGLSITSMAPIAVSWSGPRVMVRGGTFVRDVKLTRTKAATGRVRLRLMTNQTTPRRTVRRGKKNVQVNDTDRTVRLLGQAMVMPGKSNARLSIAIPADLPKTPLSLVLLADLLAADNKTTVATVTTTEVAIGSRDPYELRLAGGTTLSARAGLGKTDSIKGKIVRLGGFSGAIVVSLTGLPKGVPPPRVTVAGKKNTFELPVRFPFGTKQKEFKNVTVIASFTPNPKRADLVVRKIAGKKMTIKVTPGSKPAAKKKTKKKKK